MLQRFMFLIKLNQEEGLNYKIKYTLGLLKKKLSINKHEHLYLIVIFFIVLLNLSQ